MTYLSGLQNKVACPLIDETIAELRVRVWTCPDRVERHCLN